MTDRARSKVALVSCGVFTLLALGCGRSTPAHPPLQGGASGTGGGAAGTAGTGGNAGGTGMTGNGGTPGLPNGGGSGSGGSTAGSGGSGSGGNAGSGAGGAGGGAPDARADMGGSLAGDARGGTGGSSGTDARGGMGGSSGGDASAGSCPCSAPTPICGPDSKCTAARWVEPIATLPDRWRTKLDTKVWTKWVRSIIPVVGQAATQNAALLEVAYYAERIHMPDGQVLVPDLINSMLGAHPTRFSVYPACPNAWIHPAVKPPQSSGGGGLDDTLVTEDWVLRYPKCTGENAVACNLVKPGVLCNNCGWADSLPDTCRDTLAHEHGHTCDLHRRKYMDPAVDALATQVFPTNAEEGPAWSASEYFMNPSLESGGGRDRGRPMAAASLNYWSVTHKFTASKYPAGYGYALKTKRCPQMGLTEPCPDTLTRTYTVPLDGFGLSGPR